MLGLIVKYDENRMITGVKTVSFVPNTTKTAFAELQYDKNDTQIRSFLWEADGMKPVTGAKSKIIK